MEKIELPARVVALRAINDQTILSRALPVAAGAIRLAAAGYAERGVAALPESDREDDELGMALAKDYARVQFMLEKLAAYLDHCNGGTPLKQLLKSIESLDT